MSTQSSKIKARERDSILQSLRAGVVPRIGQQYIQVARDREIETLLSDIDRITDGGSTVRFVIGDFGSGKTFFLSLVRAIALEKRLVTVSADLNPDRRLHATGGQARSLFQELIRNMSTKGRPDGAALSTVVERFVTSAVEEARTREVPIDSIISARISSLQELVCGYDFSDVIMSYWRGYATQNQVLQSDSIKWLRGEYSTRTDARNALGVRTIVDDDNVYDMLKLHARLARLAGFGGLLVTLDEMVNLYRIANAQARNSNYEQILRIVNDSLQGVAVGIGFIFGGTPEFLMNTRRGLYSYEALQTRLQENTFATDGLTDMSGPVIRLQSLSPEDFFILLHNLLNVYAGGDSEQYLMTEEGLFRFVEHCRSRIGDAYFRTPRNTIKAFLDMLAVLDQNPGTSWQDVIGAIDVGIEQNTDEDRGDEGTNELTNLRI